jgi:hypothetical protein
LLSGELIDRLQNIAGNVADRQHLNRRHLRHWSNGSGALNSSRPKIKVSPPLSAISAASVAIVLFIYFYFVHHLILRERRGEVPKKFENFPETPETIDSVAHGRASSLENPRELGKKQLRCRNCE